MSEHLLHAMLVDAVGIELSTKRIFNNMQVSG
jgi:hypothetical protein